MKKKDNKKRKTERKTKPKLKQFLIFVILIIILTTFFFLLSILKYYDVGWDFFAYYLTGKSYFSDSFYSEPYRPFILPLILGILDKIFFFLSDKIISVIYVLLIGVLFFYALWLISKRFRLNYLVVLLFFFTPYFFHYSFLEGTELLSFTILLFILYLLPNPFDLKNNNLTHHFKIYFSKKTLFIKYLLLWVLFFIRYAFFIFIVLFLFYDIVLILFYTHSRFKKMKSKNSKHETKFQQNSFLKNIMFAIMFTSLLFSPWFIINYVLFKDPIMLLKDQYAQNVYFRCIPFSFDVVIQHFKEIINPLQLFIFEVLSIILLYPFFAKNFKSKLNLNKRVLLILFLFILILFNISVYLKTPTKISRYLYLSHVSLQLLSLIGFQMLFDLFSAIKKDKWLYALLFLILFYNLYNTYATSTKLVSIWRDESRLYFRIIKIVNDLNLTHYELNSNLWVPLIFYGLNVLPCRDINILNHSIGIYLKISDPPWINEAMKIYPVYYNDSRIVILGIKNENKTKHYTYIYHKLVKYFNKKMPSTLELFFGNYCKKKKA